MHTMALNSGKKINYILEGYEEERRITKASKKLFLADMDLTNISYYFYFRNSYIFL